MPRSRIVLGWFMFGENTWGKGVDACVRVVWSVLAHVVTRTPTRSGGRTRSRGGGGRRRHEDIVDSTRTELVLSTQRVPRRVVCLGRSEIGGGLRKRWGQERGGDGEGNVWGVVVHNGHLQVVLVGWGWWKEVEWRGRWGLVGSRVRRTRAGCGGTKGGRRDLGGGAFCGRLPREGGGVRNQSLAWLFFVVSDAANDTFVQIRMEVLFYLLLGGGGEGRGGKGRRLLIRNGYELLCAEGRARCLPVGKGGSVGGGGLQECRFINTL